MLPLLAVFTQALAKGVGAYLAAISDPLAWSAVKLTLLVAAIAVPLNLVFGVGRRLGHRQVRISRQEHLDHSHRPPLRRVAGHRRIDFHPCCSAPTAGSAAISGRNHVRIVFAVPGIVLATIFVTFPFIARELIPIMQAQGKDDEETAVSLGATGWQTFWRVTLPNIRWGLLYGVLLVQLPEPWASSARCRWCRATSAARPTPCRCTSRFYTTNTINTAAFAVASLLALLALLTLAGKSFLEWRQPELRRAGGPRARSDGEGEDMSIALRGIGKQFGEFAAVRQHRSGRAHRRTDRASRTLGLRQDHTAAHHRGPRNP